MQTVHTNNTLTGTLFRTNDQRKNIKVALCDDDNGCTQSSPKISEFLATVINKKKMKMKLWTLFLAGSQYFLKFYFSRTLFTPILSSQYLQSFFFVF